MIKMHQVKFWKWWAPQQFSFHVLSSLPFGSNGGHDEAHFYLLLNTITLLGKRFNIDMGAFWQKKELLPSQPPPSGSPN